MNQHIERAQLEDVLYAYLEAAPNPDYTTLNDWIQRYPYYEQELTDFTVARNMLHALPEPEITEQDKAELRSFGHNLVQSLFAQPTKAPEPTQSQIPSLLAIGNGIGLKLQDIAARTRLSAAIVRKLDLRLLTFATIPREAIEELAHVLQQKTDNIARYLQLPPTLAAGASYRSEQAPTLAEAEDFTSAIKKDLSIRPEDRDYWLEKAQKYNG